MVVYALRQLYSFYFILQLSKFTVLKNRETQFGAIAAVVFLAIGIYHTLLWLNDTEVARARVASLYICAHTLLKIVFTFRKFASPRSAISTFVVRAKLCNYCEAVGLIDCCHFLCFLIC